MNAPETPAEAKRDTSVGTTVPGSVPNNVAKVVPRNIPLPGMAVISIWMLAQSAIGTFGVLHHVFPPAVLIFAALFAAAAIGLLRQRRWGWALALAAAFLSMCWGTYAVFRMHQEQWVVMAVVNLVFFLYLVRPEIQQRVK
jgi:uncharacterized membrane protein (DUF2068 family)